MFRMLAAAIVIAALAGCAGGRSAPIAHAPGPRAVPTQPPPAPLPADPSEAIWHLRAGLNVAALSCRGPGRAAVAPGYTRLLTRHKALLASAYSAEQRRHGKGFDRHQTKLYNQFANQRRPAEFCRSAAQIAGQANALDSATFARGAQRLLAQLVG